MHRSSSLPVPDGGMGGEATKDEEKGLLLRLPSLALDEGSSRSPPGALVLSLGSAVLYGAMAVSMNFVNKATLEEFSLATTILLAQMVSVIFIIPPLRFLGFTSYPDITWAKARMLIPVTVLYVSNVGFALLSIQNLNIPMYNSLKRLTPVLVLLEKAYMTKKAPQRDITGSVVLVVSGCIIAGIGDFSFDLAGYAYAIASCTLQASYLILVERSGAKQGIGTSELLLYNAILSIPFLTLVVLVTGEAWRIVPDTLRAVERIGSINFTLLVSSCSLMGMFLNYAMFLCTMHNSALTTTIVGVLKGVVATVLGFFLLGGVKFHLLNVSGIALNTAGGTWYTVIKYRQRRERMNASLVAATKHLETTPNLIRASVEAKQSIKFSPVPVSPGGAVQMNGH